MSITDLIKVARTDSQESRTFLANSLNEICLNSGRDLSVQEKGLVFDIIASLINGIELQVKRNLAENLSKRFDVPKDLIVTLANDEVFDIAQPVIINSRILDDEDLIKLIIEKATNHQIAVSKRDIVSPNVSESLVNTNNENVITSLLKNEGASFKHSTMEQVVKLSQTMIKVREPLINRNDLKSELAKTMYQWIGDALKEQIKHKYDVDKKALEEEVDRAVLEALNDENFPTDPYILDKTDDNFDINETATPDGLLHALRMGDVFLFEEQFRRLTKMPAESVTRILYDSGPESLAICCKAIGINHSTFIEIYKQFSGHGTTEDIIQSPEYKKIVNYFDRIDSDGAKKVLDAWRHAPSGSW